AAAIAEAESPPTKKGGKLILIIIAVAAMVIGGGGAFVAMKLLGGSPPAEVQSTQGEPHGETVPLGQESAEMVIEAPRKSGSNAQAPSDAHAPAAPLAEGEEMLGPENIEFKPFVVNLNDVGGRRFLKLSMSMEADTPELVDEINRKMPQFRDTILLLLSSLSHDDIATLDGKMRLRNQMLNRINTQLVSGKIKNIYFSEFVVQ
ncbi:MAG: flagellar basal body-associated FliL family protein, partial [Candidatus Adiutrix sp.]